MINRYEIKEISSLWENQHKFETYLKYELALINALEVQKIAPKGSAKTISNKVNVNPTRIEEIEKEVRHDVIAFCTSITEQLSEKEARFFHYGVTSSDVIDSSVNILIKDSLQVIQKDFKELLKNIHGFALATKNIACMGRSHGINAEPLSLGGKFLSYYCEFYRRFQELEDYINKEITVQCSGAVGNYTITSTEIEKEIASQLGLKVEEVSTQVIPRDRITKLMGIIASLGATIDRICTELRHLQHSNISEVSEGFSGKQKGSSTMPHKKNPISAENLSGISRLLKSYYQVALENNNLWHERDISHSSAERFILPDSLGLTAYALRRLAGTIKGLVVHEDNIKNNIPDNHIYLSSFCLHYLIKNTSLRREDLYSIVQKASFATLNTGLNFIESLESELKEKEIKTELTSEVDLSDINKLYLKEIDAVFARVQESYPAF
jgi:adenylosuccinate lyase